MSPVEQVLARGQVALMLARWSALAGPDVLDAFLKSPMDENVSYLFPPSLSLFSTSLMRLLFCIIDDNNGLVCTGCDRGEDVLAIFGGA